MKSKQATFEIGLVMAGAISAGAYTAGVMDYLIEALDNWEKAKEKNRSIDENDPRYDKSIPMHDVTISTMGGASAGGITSIVSAIAIQNSFDHITLANRATDAIKKKNLLYNTWVNLTNDEMMPRLLDGSDITAGKVMSLFNSEFISEIAERVIQCLTPDVQRRYFSNEIEIIVSLSSLVGIPYSIGFKADARPGTFYKMKSYRDFGHFIVTQEQCNDGRIPINFKKEDNLKILRSCAMATGAFPIGLASRVVERESHFIKNNSFLLELIGTGKPDFTDFPDPFKTLVVDGGMMNNEPFEVVQELVLKNTGETPSENEDYSKFRSSIVMIDPFPCEDDEKEFKFDQSLPSMVGKIYSSMRGQLLFKPEDIEKAYDPKNASRFMIVPSRTREGVHIDGFRAIACGSLGGFGGFFNKKFREHDFYLGRRNCQKFLRDVFTTHDFESNEIFSNGYSEMQAQERFCYRENGSPKQVPIIPDVSFDRRRPNTTEETYIDWPAIAEDEILKYKGAIKDRTWKIMSNITKMNAFDRSLLWIGNKLLLGRKINTAVMNTLIKSFMEHGLINNSIK